MERKTLVDEEFREHLHPRKGKDFPAPGNMKSAEAQPRPKKKRKWWLAILIFVLLLAGAAAALYFSGFLHTWLGINIGQASAQNGISATNSQQGSAQQQATAQDDTAQQQIEAKQQELDQRESELDRRESELKSRESEMDTMEQANMSFREYRDSLSQEELASIKQVSMIYSKMDAASAAEVITQMTDRKRAALIIYNMSSAAAAAVMDAMTPEQAVEITGIMTQ